METNSSNPSTPTVTGLWQTGIKPAPSVITSNGFVYKSLSDWALNFAVGCGHGCDFCYVPSVSANKQAPKLRSLGVADPDLNWGDYVFLRTWDEKAFLKSLNRAQATPAQELKPDGNRAILLCSTTDAYQVIRHPDPKRRRDLQNHLRFVVRRSLELIRDRSTLNVRILTRSPLVRQDFDLLQSFGSRVLLGMSIPTLRADLSKIYEPKAPAPSLRLATLKDAAALGIPVFVAMAPTYPECDENDLRATMGALAPLSPMTIFHEPINIRAENVSRIEARARELGCALRTDVFKTPEEWQKYALDSLRMIERIAAEIGVANRLHLWPDKSLGTQAALKRMPEAERGTHAAWLARWWGLVSAWPANPTPSA